MRETNSFYGRNWQFRPLELLETIISEGSASSWPIAKDKAETLVELHEENVEKKPKGKTALIRLSELSELTGGHGIGDTAYE